MTKDEILAKSRQENNDKDLYKAEIDAKAGIVGAILGFVLCAIFFVAELIVCGTTNYSLWGVIAAANAGARLYSGIKLRNKGCIAIGSIWAAGTIIMIIVSFKMLYETSNIL